MSEKTILVVDDETMVINVTSAILRSEGNVCLTATNGQEGLEVFLEHCDGIAMVVTDLNMPRMNGVEMARAIKEMKPEVKIIFVSGLAADFDVDYLRTLGFILQKPFTPNQLLELVRRYLQELSF